MAILYVVIARAALKALAVLVGRLAVAFAVLVLVIIGFFNILFAG